MNASLSVSSVPTPPKSWLRAWLDRIGTAAAAEVEVRIAENDFGGWSIYAANDAARQIFGGDGPTGNFGTYADAYKRAARDNCWTVLEQ